MKAVVRLISTTIVAGLCLAASALAQGTGTISGRVFNPATQEYVKNAEIKVEGTNVRATSEAGGFFRLNNVPAGDVTVTVDFTGYRTASASVAVTAGQTASVNFDLVSTQAGAHGDGETIELEAFVVSSEREGNSKAIMNQKRNMNVTTSVASDIFGDVTDGNVGEFLKFLPGVDVDYVESETRGPRLGGMDAQYVSVSFDGVKLASADANRGGDLGRATSFEAFSISSVESIEISRTTSPDMDADSPAGSINLKTRRAFDRKGRRISYNVSLNMNSDEFTLSRTYGPGARKEAKARPNYSFEYSDVFLDQRLGIVASVNHVDSFTEQYRHNLTYNRTPTTADTRPMVLTTLNFKDGNKNIRKDTYTLTVDFKATPNLVLSNTFIYNYALGQFYNRELTFNAATNNTATNTGRQNVLGDGVTEVRTNGLASNTSRTSALAGGSASKRTHTVTLVPKFEYRLGDWTVDGLMSYSRSFNNYEALERGHTRSDDVNPITGDWVARRSSPTSHEWTIQQLSGADWFNLANRTNPRLTNEGRYALTEVYAGELNARWVTPLSIPTIVKFGAKVTEEERNNGNETPFYTWRYDGPGGGTTGSWAFLGENPNFWSTGTSNILTTLDSSGQVRPRSIPRPNSDAIADLFNSQPNLFTNIASADNFYSAYIANVRDLVQTVTAGYGMADVRLNSKLSIRTGIRWEDTENVSLLWNVRTPSEVVAAGYTVLNSGTNRGRADTIPGLRYQYQSLPRVKFTKSYDNFFPMISAKYSISENLQLHAGINKAITRPPPDSLTGSWIINEATHVITAPNPNLLPEYSKNFALRAAYYFEPAGQFSVTVTQNTIRNLREMQEHDAEVYGLGDDPVYGSYKFSAPYNVANPVRFRNLELAYSQTLTFLPELFRGTTVTMAYTRSYASQRRGNLLPHRLTSSIGYRYKAASVRLGIVWRDDTPETTVGRYRLHDTKFDLGGEYRLNKNVSLFFQGRNIFNDSQQWYETPAGRAEGDGAVLRLLENYGANWNFGLKGTF